MNNKEVLTPSGAFNEIFLSSESHGELKVIGDIPDDDVVEIDIFESNTNEPFESQPASLEVSAVGPLKKSSLIEMERIRTSSLHQLTREGDIDTIKILLDHYGTKIFKEINSLDENKVERSDDSKDVDMP